MERSRLCSSEVLYAALPTAVQTKVVLGSKVGRGADSEIEIGYQVGLDTPTNHRLLHILRIIMYNSGCQYSSSFTGICMTAGRGILYKAASIIYKCDDLYHPHFNKSAAESSSPVHLC